MTPRSGESASSGSAPAPACTLFEISDSDHAGGLPTMFARGHLDHFSLDVPDAAAFWMLRDRLIAGGYSTGDVTDFGPVIGLDFIDPDGMVGEVNLVLDPTLIGGHPPIPFDMPFARRRADRPFWRRDAAIVYDAR
jgi:hypothetical protein